MLQAIAEVENCCEKSTPMKITIVKTEAFSFHILLFHRGCNKLFIYNLTLEETNGVSDEKYENFGIDNGYMDCDSDSSVSSIPVSSSSEWKSKFMLLTSYQFHFAIYSVVDVGQKVWLLGDADPLDLKPFLMTMKCGQFDFNKLNTPIQDQKKKYCKKGQNPICSVSICQINCLLLGCFNVLNQCWSLEYLQFDGTVIHLGDVTLPTENFFDRFSSLEFGPRKLFSKNLRPYIVCVSTNDSTLPTNEIKITKKGFINLFGEIPTADTVILFGVPDGRILWSILQSGLHKRKNSLKFSLLCDIEQPIRGIYKFSEDNDDLVIIGCLGKVLVLQASDSTRVIMETNNSFIYDIFHIPSPVCSYMRIETFLYHTTMDGQLWLSKWQNFSLAQDTGASNKNLSSDMVDATQLSNLKILLESEGLGICMTLDGCIYLANLTRSGYGIPQSFDNRMSFTLTSCYEMSSQLQALTFVKQQQMTLFSQLAWLLSEIDSKSQAELVSCTLHSICDKIIVETSFYGLQNLNIDPNFWYLSVSISKDKNQIHPRVRKILPFGKGNVVSIEVDSTFFSFEQCSVMPWFIQASLLLNIPQTWQNISCFKFVNNHAPFCLQLKTIVVHGLHFLQAKKESSWDNSIAKHSESNVHPVIESLSLNHKPSRIQNLQPAPSRGKMLSEFILRLSHSTTKSIEEQNDQNSALFKGVVSINRNLSQEHSFLCLNHSICIKFQENENFHNIKLTSNCFLILGGLRFSFLHTLQQADKRSCSGCVTVSPHLCERIEGYAKKIHKALENCSSQDEELSFFVKLYIGIRQELSSKLYL